ncbi:hypothetical protein DESUT3_00810 [Desulfuromonas versatilis]|uniref:Type VI secretion system lipoprotein TssJ n=1 Tax=Desulfuromonas versatilis TaxID=2802975 RepID=A0ABM8HLP7_9BACT|nr:type VI secretion system lipoprotein TssJ [Desulfuromonas versatilis]BCR03012.1 hypothetical protein DESUT3_00810 [Desulfuromonas versatilis]
MKFRNLSCCFWLLVLLCLAAGCSPPQVKMGLSSTANLNLNDFDEPLPVMVNIYQLSDAQPFSKASFEELWKKDLMTLGDSLLTKETLTLNPASQERLEYLRHDQARYIAVMAVFRKPEKEAWRDVRPVADGFFKKRFSSKVTVNLKGNSVEFVD